MSWVIFDLHGSVVALCPAGSSTLSDAYRYDAWGQPMTSGSTVNPWRYRGLLDVSPMTANPVLAMGARFYQPSIAAFTQEDSVQGRATDPLSMNRYLYAEADPATLVDSDGHGVDCGVGEVCISADRRADLKASAATLTKAQVAYRRVVDQRAEARYTNHRIASEKAASSTAGGASACDASCQDQLLTALLISRLRRYANAVDARAQAERFLWDQLTLAPLMLVNPVPLEGEGSVDVVMADELSGGELVAGEEIPLDRVLTSIAARYQRGVLSTFEGDPVAFQTTRSTYWFRYSSAGKPGWYYSPTLFSSPDEARAALALPATNSALTLQYVKVDPTNILYGVARDMSANPDFGPSAIGGGLQVYVPDQSAVTVLPVDLQPAWP